jgi:hypothetical protein
MRIDSSGRFGMGTSAAITQKMVIDGSSVGGEQTLKLLSTNTTGGASQGIFSVYNSYSGSGAERMIIRANGDIQNQNGSYTAYSDARLKTNIVDARSHTEDLCKLRVVNYNWVDGDGEKLLGFIAQEVEQVMPNLVAESPTEKLADMKSVKISVMIPMLVQAIQELNAKVEAQAATITALQSKVGA